MSVAMVPLIHASRHHYVAVNAWVTGMVVVAALAVLAMCAYLVVAAKPDSDTVMCFLFVGLVLGFAWPAVALLPVVGLVYGLRWMVHGPKPSLSRAARRDARIRRRDERIAELERELKL